MNVLWKGKLQVIKVIIICHITYNNAKLQDKLWIKRLQSIYCIFTAASNNPLTCLQMNLRHKIVLLTRSCTYFDVQFCLFCLNHWSVTILLQNRRILLPSLVRWQNGRTISTKLKLFFWQIFSASSLHITAIMGQNALCMNSCALCVHWAMLD